MTEKDTQEGFKKGREDFFAGKKREQNPFPPISPRHEPWHQGWDAENEIHQKN